ncbi:MAG: cardiolipin synthase ClsB [Rhodoferax sp.]|nr:cardiolipin synthase ClsB [Rhodoferax sp.]MCW5642608.1 cardiolipin synthase ClsB [Rhodoferax sp.]
MAALRAHHQITLLQGGSELFPEMIRAIDGARREVRVETYIFHFDPSGERVATALEQAALRGVQVYLAMDGVGTPALPPSWARRFDDSGVQWRIFMPLGRLGVFIPSRWRRLHRKLCVVDAALAFCGGINILDDRHDPAYGALQQPRLDFAVRITGPLVQDALETMQRFWWRMTVASELRDRELPAAWQALQERMRATLAERHGPSGDSGAAHARPSPPHGPPGRGARADLVLRDNLRHRRRIERAYLRAIGAARHEIIIANAYFLPGARLRKALVLAARRGVRVRLLLQGRYEYFLQYHAARPVYGALLDAGVEIHEYATSFLHAKVAVVDTRWATVGSSNLDPLSLLLAREANVMVRDAAFARLLRQRLEHAMADGGHRVEAAAYVNRSWRTRVLEALALGMVRLGLFLIGRRY